MDKMMVMFFLLCVFLNPCFLSAEQTEVINRDVSSTENKAPDAGLMAQDFIKTAVSEFKSIDDTQLSYPEISSRMQKYSQNFAQILMDAGLDANTCGAILSKASFLYGQTLQALFEGKNFNAAIQDYSTKISDLFSQQHLNVATQSKIVAMTSDNLESMNSLFKDLEGNESY